MRGQSLRCRAAHPFGAAGNCVLARLARERPDVSGELPDLIVGQLAAPRRHAVRTTGGDRRGDLVDAAAVAPLVVHQGRTDGAATVRMAANTIHLGIEEL